MRILHFNHWVDKKVTDHDNIGVIQTIENHHINIWVFSFKWKALEWTKYISQDKNKR